MISLYLVVTRSGETKRHALDPGRSFTVGRGNDADIMVPDISISRQQFTLTPQGDGVRIDVSPQSRNLVVLNGQPVQSGLLRPGDRLSVGYCSFALLAEAAVPVAKPAEIPGDPAGYIDPALAEAEEMQRIAPKWMAEEEDQKDKAKKAAAQKKIDQKPKSATEKLALPLSFTALLGIVGYFYVLPMLRPAETLTPPDRLDLFADPPPVECGGPEQCFERASRSYEYGKKLAEQSGTSLDNLYKASRQFQTASLALKGQNYRLPELQPRYDAIRKQIITRFDDARLRLIRAQQDNNPRAALSAIEEQLLFLQDSTHPYRDQLLRARSRVIELAEQQRREQIQQGKVTP